MNSIIEGCHVTFSSDFIDIDGPFLLPIDECIHSLSSINHTSTFDGSILLNTNGELSTFYHYSQLSSNNTALLHQIHIVDTDIPRDINEKYIRSYNQWQHVKKLWNNSYQYTSEKSSWTGYRSSTTIFVLNGEVVGREFSAFDRGQLSKHWFENKDQLYSHGQTSGEIQLGTLDNIYSACLQSLNISNPNSRQKYRLTFEVDTANHGLLKSCGYYPIGCADDCFFGVLIDNLKSYQQHQPSNS
ncbi:unnamed protein product, partial [Rotaria sordida]